MAALATGTTVVGNAVSESGKPPNFLQKLFDFLSIDPHPCPDVIYWAADSKQLVVAKPERLAKEVLPRLFKHDKISSFGRQLNIYGFSRVFPGRQFKDASGRVLDASVWAHPTLHRLSTPMDVLHVKRRAAPKLFRTRRLANGHIVRTRAGPDVERKIHEVKEDMAHERRMRGRLTASASEGRYADARDRAVSGVVRIDKTRSPQQDPELGVQSHHGHDLGSTACGRVDLGLDCNVESMHDFDFRRSSLQRINEKHPLGHDYGLHAADQNQSPPDGAPYRVSETSTTGYRDAFEDHNGRSMATTGLGPFTFDTRASQQVGQGISHLSPSWISPPGSATMSTMAEGSAGLTPWTIDNVGFAPLGHFLSDPPGSARGTHGHGGQHFVSCPASIHTSPALAPAVLTIDSHASDVDFNFIDLDRQHDNSSLNAVWCRSGGQGTAVTPMQILSHLTETAAHSQAAHIPIAAPASDPFPGLDGSWGRMPSPNHGSLDAHQLPMFRSEDPNHPQTGRHLTGYRSSSDRMTAHDWRQPEDLTMHIANPATTVTSQSDSGQSSPPGVPYSTQGEGYGDVQRLVQSSNTRHMPPPLKINTAALVVSEATRPLKDGQELQSWEKTRSIDPRWISPRGSTWSTPAPTPRAGSPTGMFPAFFET